MNILNRISFNQLILFIDLLSTYSDHSIDNIEPIYTNNALYLSETLEFLKDIELLIIHNNSIVPNNDLNKYIQENSTKHSHKKLSELIIYKLLASSNSYSSYILDYFSLFHNDSTKYISKPNTSSRLKFSSIRNLFMELGVVMFNADDDSYYITGEHLESVLNLIKSHQLSYKDMQASLKNKEKLGLDAEKIVLVYEINRLNNQPLLQEQIEHTSKINVSAGYDIKSFTIFNENNAIPRYIEVKAVSIMDYKFYWSRNEIETARKYQNEYYLYLLPVDKGGKLSLSSLLIIRNPANYLFSNDNWEISEELFSFSILDDTEVDHIKGHLI